MTVVGAARSGIAAARSARAPRRVGRAHRDARQRSRAPTGCSDAGVTLELGGHRAETLAEADLVVTSPGVPIEQPVFDAARRRGVEIIGELELAWRWISGPVIAITGTKGKSTTTTLDRSHAGGRRAKGAGRRQHRRAVERAGRRVDAGDDPRRRDEQLSARDDHVVPAVDCRLAELRRRPPRPASGCVVVRGGEGADLREPDRRRLGGGERRRPARVGAEREHARAPCAVLARGRPCTTDSSWTATGSWRRTATGARAALSSRTPWS